MIGFLPSLYDENLWVLCENGGSLAHVSAYVDDVLISSRVPFQFYKQLKKVHNLKTD